MNLKEYIAFQNCLKRVLFFVTTLINKRKNTNTQQIVDYAAWCDMIVGLEARGYRLDLQRMNQESDLRQLVKKEELPRETVADVMILEYGSTGITLTRRCCKKPGQKVLICDDLCNSGTMAPL